jgi:hypothetical protein
MWTTDTRTTRLTTTKFVSALAAAAFVIGALSVMFLALDRPDSARGAVVGGGLVVALLVLARWRAVRRSSDAGSAARIGAGAGDERDRLIMMRALATTGYASFVTLTGASIAVLAGADGIATVAIAMFVQVGVLAVAFAVAARRG